MAGNKALASMTSLLDLNAGAQEAQTAEDALNRLEPDAGGQAIPDTDEEGKARFGTAEAIATAIVGTALLGPIGGIIIGGAQGFLQRKNEQSILDQMASENNAITDAMAVYEEQFSALEASAENPEDLARISAMRAQASASFKLMTQGGDKLKDAGLQGFAGMQDDLINYTDLQETQRIARDTQEEQLKRDLGEQQYSRYTKLQDDFTIESSGYLARKQAATVAIDALENGSPSDLHAAIILFNKTLDPNSAVLGEERAAITEFGGLLDKSYNFLNKQFDGSQINAKQRRDIGTTISNIMQTSTQFQLAREGSYTEQVALAELPERFYDDFSLVTDTPAVKPPEIPEDLLEQSLRLDKQARDNQSMFIGDTVDTVRDFFSGDSAEDERRNAIMNQRRLDGADPRTGIYPINRPTN